MNSEDIVSGKLARTSKTIGIAAKSGVKHLQYLRKKRITTEPEQLRQKHEEELGKLLFKGLSQMRGTALKASQLLSLETDLIPEGVRRELGKSYYQVPPVNKAHVRKMFIQEFGVTPGELFSEFQSEAFAAASLGQVHKAQLSDAQSKKKSDVAVKVQYPGIGGSIDSDLSILSALILTLSKTTNMLSNKNVLETTIDELSNCLRDEINYTKEAQRTKWFQEKLNVINLKIPNVYFEYSSARILTTELLCGKHIDEWLSEKPSQEQRNVVGQTIFNAFLVCSFELRALHADPHPGNYLVLDTGEVALLDFGCIKHLSEDFTSTILALMHAVLDDDLAETATAYKQLGLISKELSMEEYCSHVHPVLAPLQHWISLPFRVKEFDFSELPPVPSAAMQSQQKKMVKYLHSVKRDQIYFDRTYIGIYLLLHKIGAVVGTENPWIYPSAKKKKSLRLS